MFDAHTVKRSELVQLADSQGYASEVCVTRTMCELCLDDTMWPPKVGVGKPNAREVCVTHSYRILVYDIGLKLECLNQPRNHFGSNVIMVTLNYYGHSKLLIKIVPSANN